jgi:hypothetical protein
MFWIGLPELGFNLGVCFRCVVSSVHAAHVVDEADIAVEGAVTSHDHVALFLLGGQKEIFSCKF